MNESEYHDRIILTTKFGKQDKTKEIQHISYVRNKNVYWITFKDGKKYPFKGDDVQILKNTLKEAVPSSVFQFLLRMAEFSELKNDDDENLLVKNFSKTEFIGEDSALSLYINQGRCIKHYNEPDLIFPFGSNNSQYDAVRNALMNQLSIIQGPPGTGKTQTILNIIANLLIQNKSVLVVSNNNSATANVAEKLASSKYGMDFICATLGKFENMDAFLKGQKEVYPSHIEEWGNINAFNSATLSKDCRRLGDLFDNNERISSLLYELDNLKLEQQHFADSNSDSDFYENIRLLSLSSSMLMQLWQTLQHKYNTKEKLGIITSIKLIFAFGIKSFKFWDINPEKIIFSIKRTYYIAKLKEVSDELEICRSKKFDIVPDDVYKESLYFLKSSLYKRYTGKKRPIFKDSKDVFRNFDDFQKEYPIILSTTFSSRNCVPFTDPDALYDYVIMDEASQVDVVTGALALSCARNAVIVGDKMQLPNVITDEKRQQVTEVFNLCNANGESIAEGYNFIHSFLESVELLFPETPQTLLREHYRCHPKIINFCNQKFYGGRLLIMTEDKGEDDVLTAYKTVPGNHCSNMYNQRQIDVIKEEIMPVLADKGVKPEDIGIVAPYNNQVNKLKAQLPDLDSATVHKFQGREKDSIIISTVDNEITPFTDDAKMLNVAISRAKKQLFVVVSGNEQRADSNIMELVRYIQYNNFTVEESKVNSIFDYLYSNYTRERFAYLDKIKKISKFDSENLMYKLISDILAEDEFSKYGVVFEMPLNDIVSKSGAAELPEELRIYASRSWAHCDFVIYNKVTKSIVCGIEVDGYKYHKSGTKQSVRDKKKDEVFKFISIPLLRCSTKESGEEERIRDVLRGGEN